MIRTSLTVLLTALLATTALAEPNYTGVLQGRATETPTDLNGDVPFGGCYARDFVARVLGTSSSPDQIVLFEGLIDAGLVDPTFPHQGVCDAGFAELSAVGHVMVRSADGTTLQAEFDPLEVVCFQPGQPEYFTLYIVGGGTIDIVLNDLVPIVGANGCPNLVDVNGTYTIHK